MLDIVLPSHVEKDPTILVHYVTSYLKEYFGDENIDPPKERGEAEELFLFFRCHRKPLNMARNLTVGWGKWFNIFND